MDFKVSIIGLGFVGSSMYKSFELKGVNVIGYDKYKNGGIGSLKECYSSNIMFLCLPTQYDSKLCQYDKSNIYNTCDKLQEVNYKGLVVIKCTVEPETTDDLSKKYPSLYFVHNPEFLTARTAFEDFHNQTHIVLGKGLNCSEEQIDVLENFYKTYYKNAEISRCTSLESESMKIFCNSYYAMKVQFFTELYLICENNGSNYEKIKDMMIKNNWINPMHTTIPGPDGQISYGGLCFPKDTNALLKYMEKNDLPRQVLKSTIEERNEMRNDHDNCN